MALRELTAKFNSRCVDCKAQIKIGGPYMWEPGQKGRCVDCGQKHNGASVNLDAPLDLSRVNLAPRVVKRLENPSPYQQAIFDEIENGTGSIIVEAVAGSGKTTTIVEATYHMPVDASVRFVAFNKSIADELRERLPQHVEASTFHSMCFRAINNQQQRKVNKYKVSDIAKSMIESGQITADEWAKHGAQILKLVGIAKNAGVGVMQSNTDETWENLAAHFDVTFE